LGSWGQKFESQSHRLRIPARSCNYKRLEEWVGDIAYVIVARKNWGARVTRKLRHVANAVDSKIQREMKMGRLS